MCTGHKTLRPYRVSAVSWVTQLAGTTTLPHAATVELITPRTTTYVQSMDAMAALKTLVKYVNCNNNLHVSTDSTCPAKAGAENYAQRLNILMKKKEALRYGPAITHHR